MKPLLLLRWLCSACVALMPATMLAAPKKQPAEAADKLHTPAAGSAERTGIMDGLREYYKAHPYPNAAPWKGRITFRVNYLKVHNGWAWIQPEPQSSDSKDSFGENDGYLLHLTDGRWAVMAMPKMDDNLDGSRAPTATDIARLQKKYPSLPADIIPKD